MIFRRFIAHLHQQDWVAVAIELAIVVLGVFIGLQVNEWGAAQAAERRGHEYVQRLTRDLEEDLVTRQNLAVYYDAVNESAERANTLLQQPSPDPTALVVNAYRATEYTYAAPNRSTWDEVVSSGDISLLPRSAVDGGMAEYYASNIARDVLDAMKNSAYRRLVRSLIPHEVQKAIREGCGEVRDPQNQNIARFRDDCHLNVSAGDIAAAARALQRDVRVREELRYQFSEIATARVNLRGDVFRIEGGLRGLREARR